MKLSFTQVVVLALVSAVSATPAPTKVTERQAAGAGTPCSPQVLALASGISANIADQRNEQAAVTAVGNILSEDPVNATSFAAAKGSLLDFVNKGIAIRENNQKIAPAGNPAIAGLAIVAMAQIAEFNLTNSLTGVPSTDNKTVETLKADFAGGIMQNMKNLAAATGNCTVPK